MTNVVALKREPIALKAIHCEKCGGHKFSALQDETTINLQLWCTDCWTIVSNIELKDTHGK